VAGSMKETRLLSGEPHQTAAILTLQDWHLQLALSINNSHVHAQGALGCVVNRGDLTAADALPPVSVAHAADLCAGAWHWPNHICWCELPPGASNPSDARSRTL
jgi:hypothetical protein